MLNSQPSPIIGIINFEQQFLFITNTLLHEGRSKPEFYGDLVYKFKRLMGRNGFSHQFRKIIIRCKRIGYYLILMRQSACIVFIQIYVDYLNCTPVSQTSDLNIFNFVGCGRSFLSVT